MTVRWVRNNLNKNFSEIHLNLLSVKSIRKLSLPRHKGGNCSKITVMLGLLQFCVFYFNLWGIPSNVERRLFAISSRWYVTCLFLSSVDFGLAFLVHPAGLQPFRIYGYKYRCTSLMCFHTITDWPSFVLMNRSHLLSRNSVRKKLCWLRCWGVSITWETYHRGPTLLFVNCKWKLNKR